MLSSARPSVPPRPRSFDAHKHNHVVQSKSTTQSLRRDDKTTRNTPSSTNSSSVSRTIKVSAEPPRAKGSNLGRSAAGETKVAQGKNVPVTSKLKSKLVNSAPDPSSVLDPNCNEPSLPCLCCDGHSPHDSNSLYNHNYNNNNTTAIRQQLRLQPVQQSTVEDDKSDDSHKTQQNPEVPTSPSHNALVKQQQEKSEQNQDMENSKADEVEDYENNDDDEEDEDTLVPSCHDCPPSLLEFSLSSSTSSSSTSISSCSDFESDCLDTSCFLELSFQQKLPADSPISQPQIIPMGANCTALPPVPPFSPDEGYPSARSSPSSDYMEHKASLELEATKLNLLTFLNSSNELDRVDHWSKVVQVARWGMEGDIGLKYRLSHLEKLKLVNKQMRITYLQRIRESGLELDEEDLSDSLDGIGEMELPWKLYRGDNICESQEFSDAGVDLSAPSDLDEPLQPDSLAPSPLQPPPRPPKPPVRNPDSHTYVNVNNNPHIPPSASSATPALRTISPASSSSSGMPEKNTPTPSPLLLAPSQPTPYFTFYSSTPPLASPPPPIPPPRRRHKARLEAQRFTNSQDESTPLSLPPPTSRPPPLPPPPALPSPPAVPPPPSLPPPPSFHALDAEIRKLLVLAGLTQAELLKLSPELGVCVTGVLEEGDGELSDIVEPPGREDASAETERKRDRERKEVLEEEWGEGEKDEAIGEMRGTRKEGASGEHEQDVLMEGVVQEKNREAFHTTSFTEMARRRKHNTFSSNCSSGSGLETSSNSVAYYNTSNITATASSHGMSSSKNYDDTMAPGSSPPPPPPPRPLPLCPPELPQPPPLPPLALCMLPANAVPPDRSDWLIAFSPDTETPPYGADRSVEVSPQKVNVGSKVTTFKELRFRSKQNPQSVLVQPEPDPTVITPDPDVLYNLKWRKEKADGDGSQWEYVPQVQSIFHHYQPPTWLPEKRELLQVTEVAGQAKSCPLQRIGFSASDGDLWTAGATGGVEKPGKKEEEEGAVRGRADGGRKWELGTAVSSPPLSLVLSSPKPVPYFLHSEPQIPPLYQASAYRVTTHSTGLRQSSQGVATASPISQNQSDSLYSADPESPIDSLYCADDTSNVDSLYCTKVNCTVESLSRKDTEIKTVPHHYYGDREACAETEGCTTPYRNIEAIVYSRIQRQTEPRADDLQKPSVDENRNELVQCPVGKGPCPEPPAWYFYSPQNCPQHKGASPRLSPVGAISPPHRCGAPSPGADVSRLHSPLFPRSRTLPALSAPLYHPFICPTSAIAPLKDPQAPILTKQTQLYTLTVRSLSFAGSAQRGGAWMAEGSKIPLRGHKQSSLYLEEKRALVSAVSVAVEAILAQFSSSRTLVQKAQSGDSSINPALGRLVLQCLCPALQTLLSDGLKPHQSDLIAGRRPNSPWGLVQASTRPGPSTQALYTLQCRVAELPQLRQSRHRFNAFLLGLLNIKLLDYWLSHLQSCDDVLSTYYLPTSFMRLSHSLCQPLFEELLLLLQPLSLLTFSLDLLFQHHHLDPASPSPSPSSHSTEAAGISGQGSSFQISPKGLTCGNRGHLESVSEHNFGDFEIAVDSQRASPRSSGNSRVEEQADQSPMPKPVAASQFLWMQEKDVLPPGHGSFSQQAGQVIQQGWGAVVRWGERLGQNWNNFNISSQGTSGGDNPPSLSQHVWSGDSPGNVAQPDIISHQTQGDLPSDRTPAVPWGLGRLFGASRGHQSEQTRTSSTRRPSHWLAPGVSALSRIVSPTLSPVPEDRGGSSEGTKKAESDRKAKTYRSVRTLCDHTGTGEELSFHKGEELVVLGTVNHDWVRCRRGDREGLVPIGYTSLIM